MTMIYSGLRHGKRTALSLCMFVAWLLAIGGCAHTFHPPGSLPAMGLAGFYCAEHASDGTCAIYRGAQPQPAQALYLADHYGIRTVIKLNTALPFDGGHDVWPPSVELIHHPLLPAGPVTPAQSQAIQDDLESAPKPIFLHCKEGVDRTGLELALWRVHHGVAAINAFAEWVAFGSHRLHGLEEAFELETGYTQ